MSGNIIPETLQLAEDESRRARCFFVGTEHLFLALARKGGADIEECLAAHRTTLAKAVRRVHKLVHHWDPGEDWSGLLQHTPRLKSIARQATFQAERQSGKSPEAIHFLTALLEDGHSHTTRTILAADKPLPKIKPENSLPRQDQSVENGGDEKSSDMDLTFSPAGTEGDRTSGRANSRGGYSNLERYGRDVTQLAEVGNLPTLIGRDNELKMLMRTLTRQSKPNPIIIGEPGTGKTALVEGLAQAIRAGLVPEMLRQVRIVELSLTSIVAGTQYRGEFENRIEEILAEVTQSPEIILFLDEFHLAVGAGAAGGGMDVANVIKPALARGGIRLIAATTLREYRKSIEPDSALSRRFQPILLNEPDSTMTLQIIRGIKSRLEEHHSVSIEDEAVEATVEFSNRYESDRQQPDKSIDLLDDACTRATFHTVQPDVPQDTVGDVVTVEHVARAVSDRTGIPIGSLTGDEFERLANLERQLSREIQGQSQAVKSVVDTLRQLRLSLQDNGRPGAVFLFAGSTGIGKTALAELVAHEYFGLPDSLIRIDLSEYMEPHNLSRLIGAPPGYVGHDEQGQLTRALRTRPHSLVLLDEIEKADPLVLDVFLQVFGSGRLTDGRGEVIDCRQAMFVMTTNLGADSYHANGQFGFAGAVTNETSAKRRNEAVQDACQKHFRTEFLNRVDRVICFNPLTDTVLRDILRQLAEKLVSDLSLRNVSLEIAPEVHDHIIQIAGTSLGVPPLKRLLHEQVVSQIAKLIVNNSVGKNLNVKAFVGNGRIQVAIPQGKS